MLFSGQDIIGFLDFQKPLPGKLLKFLAKMRNFVGMILVGQAAVGIVDLLFGSFGRKAENSIWVFFIRPTAVCAGILLSGR